MVLDSINHSVDGQLTSIIVTPSLTWRELAAAGRIADAIVALVRKRDHVSFVELERFFSPFMQTTGDRTIELRRNVVLWSQLSCEMEQHLLQLVDNNRLFLWPATWFTYAADGCILQLPIAKRPPAQGYKRPRWLPVVFRTTPLDGNGKGVAR